MAADAPLVFMFPGQSSRYPGLIRKLILHSRENAKIVERASEVLGRDLVNDLHPDNQNIFDRNEDIQLAVFLANAIHAAMLRRIGIAPDLSLGLSLGEYNHIVDIGALPFDAALGLVAARGALYDQGPAGAMAAVGPIEAAQLDHVVARASAFGLLERAVESSPTQHVIAGARPALDAALDILEQEHFVPGELIEEKLPMHTSSFRDVAERFRQHLESCRWQPVNRPYVSNATGTIIPEATPAILTEHLSTQVWRRVQWRRSIEAILQRSPKAVFIEVGPRAVLYNLLQPRWIPNSKFKTDGAGENELAVDAVRAGLIDRLAP